MPSLDLRTRTSDTVREIDVPAFFADELPELAATRSVLAVPGARELGVKPFTLACPAGEWTLAVEDDEIVVRAGDGDDDSGRVFLSDDEVGKLVNDLITPMTLVASASEHIQRGDHGNFLDWWVVLRSLIDDRPAHTAGSIEFRDVAGDPLDLERSFTPADSDADMGQFLAEAGCLHLSGWFDPAEMDAIGREMDAAFDRYTPDDGRSWWAETADGTKRAVRLQKFEEHSPTFAALLEDDRFARIGRLTGDEYESRHGGEALEKPLGVVKGISDLMWHKDCALGMHSYRCCGLTVGISVTGAGETSGQLAVSPGSHRALDPARLLPQGLGPAGASAADRAGRRDRPLLVHVPHEPPADRARAPRHLHRLLAREPGRHRAAERGRGASGPRAGAQEGLSGPDDRHHLTHPAFVASLTSCAGSAPDAGAAWQVSGE